MLSSIDSITGTVNRYLRLMSDGISPTSLARELGNELLAGAIADLPPGITRLLIVPELSLYRVPFDALILADNRYVVERYTVAIVPSATFALSLADLPAERPRGSLLALGDALYSSQSARARTMIPGRDSRAETLPRLPYSGDEVRRIARYSRVPQVLVRGAASENALLRANLSNVRVLHLATHALIDDENL